MNSHMYPPGLVDLATVGWVERQRNPSTDVPRRNAHDGFRLRSTHPTSLSGENRLRDHAVDALGAVDHLGDVIVHRDARDHVGLLARELREALGDEKDG